MTIDATNSSKEGMNCARVAREETLEAYLLGRLSEEDRNAYEEHYFECAECFDELRALQATREELSQTSGGQDSRTPLWYWLAVVSALGTAALLVVGLTLSVHEPSPPTPSETRQASPPPIRSTEPTQPAGPATAVDVADLAKIEPPKYQPLKFRGTADEATLRFQSGMGRYQRADYRAAAAELEAAATIAPDAPHIRFFLGICRLMLGNDDAAIAQFQATIAIGDSPYLEEARLYLAKAYLRRKQLGAAEMQLKKLTELRGPHSNEAGRLLTKMETLKSPQH